MMECCKISNSKHQITNKSQIPILNDQNTKQVWSAGGGLVIVICLIFVISDLEFLFLLYSSTPKSLVLFADKAMEL